MKNYEVVGNVIGALLGAILTGVAIYYTGSVFSSVIGFLGFLIGGWIGKSIKLREI